MGAPDPRGNLTKRLLAMSRRCTCQAGVTTTHGDADWVLRHWTERIGGRRGDQRTRGATSGGSRRRAAGAGRARRAPLSGRPWYNLV
jgi:hypothetical protein